MLRLVAFAMLCLLLAACGGREDKSEPRERPTPAAPPVSLPQLY
jgi:hypothetical protein